MKLENPPIPLFGSRAGAFLEISFPGGAKDKRIAQALGVSPNMARLLRHGRSWTLQRLDQLVALFPAAAEFIFPPTEQLYQRLDRLAAGLDALRAEFEADRAARREETAALRDEIRSLKG